MADPPFVGDITGGGVDGGGLYLTTALNNEEIEGLLSRDSKSSQQAEKYAVLKFRHYLSKRGEPLSLENLCYHVTSGDMAAKERLLAYLTTFFSDLRRADGSKYKFNALRSIRYALNRFTLKFGVDFLNDAYLKKTLNDAWVALGEHLKLEGKADVQHHDILSLEEVKKAYGWCNHNLSDPDRLQKRVFMDMYLYFGRQCRQNLPHLTKDNFGMDVDVNNLRYVYFIDKDGSGMVCDGSSKVNHQIVMRERVGFANCPVKTFLKYVSKLDPHYPRFFCHQKLNVDPVYHTVWYTKQPMGEKKMAEFMKAISSDAGLSKVYTNHCLRSTLLYLMEEGGLEAKDVSRLTCSQATYEGTVPAVLTSQTQHSRPSPSAQSITTASSTTNTWPPQVVNTLQDRNKTSQEGNISQIFSTVPAAGFTLNSFGGGSQTETKPLPGKDVTESQHGDQIDFKLRHSEFVEVQKQQAELAEAKKRQAEERQQKLAEKKIYKYMVLNHEKKVLETLRSLWKGNQFCDAMLQNECVSIPVHKILLIACCPKILDTYDYIMKDTNVQVCFPRKVTADALRAFVDYLYNGSLNLSKSILDSMEYLSGMLGLDDIRQLCGQFRSDLFNNSGSLPDKTIVNVSHSQTSSGHHISLDDPTAPPPPIVRPSIHNISSLSSSLLQMPSSSHYQGIRKVTYSQKSIDDRYNLLSHSDSDIVNVSTVKLEPEVDLTEDDCTEIKQETSIYGNSNDCQFDSWSQIDSQNNDSSSSHLKKNEHSNFGIQTTVDLSVMPLESFSTHSRKSAAHDDSDLHGIITISPSSSSPIHSVGSSVDVQTLQVESQVSALERHMNPFPVSLVMANNHSIPLCENNRKKKNSFDDYDCDYDSKKAKIIL